MCGGGQQNASHVRGGLTSWDSGEDPLLGGRGKDLNQVAHKKLPTVGIALIPLQYPVNKFENTRLNPGDTILVPEKIERPDFLKNMKDVTQILYQIAVTAGITVTQVF